MKYTFAVFLWNIRYLWFLFKQKQLKLVEVQIKFIPRRTAIPLRVRVLQSYKDPHPSISRAIEIFRASQSTTPPNKLIDVKIS
jgi:hypothetical protein